MMTHAFNHNYTAMSQLIDDAIADGWLESSVRQRLKNIETQNADELFISSATRPLVVAFFGGTGTGKSSLLNRLANDTIAKTGITRPTSHEVTLYLHNDIELSAISDKLPIDSINIKRHNNESRKMVAWLDMPDFDSTATTNRDLVEIWLPYIDWLVYVVSPERYQDDSGWQILLERSQRHRWLFVMNHWDEGNEQQISDFENKLTRAGIEEPIVLRTSCIEPWIDDDFKHLEQSVQDAIDTFGMDLLKRAGLEARTEELQQLLSHIQTIIGDEQRWRDTRTILLDSSSKQLTTVLNIIETSIRINTQTLIDAEPNSLNPFKKATATLPDTKNLVAASQSQRSITLLDDMTRALPLSQGIIGKKIIENQFKNLSRESQIILTEELESGLERALAKPGSGLQRLLYRFTGTLSWLLPLLASSWAAYHLFITYYQGTTGNGQFLGSNFAIHSLLMISISWLMPYILHRRLRPSLASAARTGLQNGLKSAKSRLRENIDLHLQLIEKSHHKHINSINVLKNTLS